MPVSAITHVQTAHKQKEKQQEKAKSSYDPGQNLKEEVWKEHRRFPRTVGDFQELRFYPDKVKSLLEWYNVAVYYPEPLGHNIYQSPRSSSSSISSSGPRSIDNHASTAITAPEVLEVCLEQLAITWGISWQRTDGLERVQRHDLRSH